MSTGTAARQQTSSNTDLDTKLNYLLASYQVLYQKLRSYHWNVEGPRFFELHEQFEVLYNDLDNRIDEIAERIRSRDEFPVSTMEDSLSISAIEEDGSQPEAEQMVQNLVNDYQTINKLLKDGAETADQEGDSSSSALLEDYLAEQEKQLWMLKSTLSG